MIAGLLAEAPSHLAATRIALAVWLMLNGAHWMVGAQAFRPDGVAAWGRMAGRGVLGAVRRRMPWWGLRLWMAIEMTLAAMLAFAGSPALASACLLAALVSHAGFIVLTREQAVSGADKMGLIVLAGTLIATIAVARGDAALLLAGCLVSGGQLVICYHVAGTSKLLQSGWRDGSELQGVMGHAVWGTPWAAALVRPRIASLAASWALMLGEALFLLALLLPQPWLMAALAAMFGFHIATAVVMRLTTFPWAFVAAYPAVLMLGRVVRDMLA
jgi:hypothetical protein